MMPLVDVETVGRFGAAGRRDVDGALQVSLDGGGTSSTVRLESGALLAMPSAQALEEIVVTAQKRDERLIDVVTAVSSVLRVEGL